MIKLEHTDTIPSKGRLHCILKKDRHTYQVDLEPQELLGATEKAKCSLNLAVVDILAYRQISRTLIDASTSVHVMPASAICGG
jgi:hypothetical protein